MKTQTAYSLLELLVVIAIIGLLGAIGFFNYNAYTQTVRLREVSNSIAQLFQDTAARSISRGQKFTVNFSLNQAAGADITITGDGSSTNLKLESDAKISSVQVGGVSKTSVDFVRGRPETGTPETLVLKTALGSLTGTVRLLTTGKTVIQ